MAKDQRNVEAITPMEEDFAKWYTDICLKAELVDYSSVKGFTILRPYGYAIWENIQKLVDAELKRTNHVNVAMPVLIPENLLKKEGELVEGFAPEAAWVTMGGSEKLEERMALRPTSETMFCDHWSHVLHSYRELPMLYNQWCSVVRWEKTTRPFLRTREFWWQEGHTIHETAEEAIAETEMILNIYADLCRDKLAMPVVRGRKTDKEKFAGAEATYTIESMMKDRKALQAGTSHYFGDKFSRAYDVTFTGRDNTLQYPFQTSWAVTTRLVGAIIMTHGDNHGLVLPPAIAPIQVAVIPVAQHKPGVLDAAAAIRDRLTAAGLREEPRGQHLRHDLLGGGARHGAGPRRLCPHEVVRQARVRACHEGEGGRLQPLHAAQAVRHGRQVPRLRRGVHDGYLLGRGILIPEKSVAFFRSGFRYEPRKNTLSPRKVFFATYTPPQKTD